ncbi:MAG TPA: isoprenylcysteine carboxylmethyltransferase family protein [Caulobacteraceae bacterium]|nr:isoprenylcysteine carboxylmethyltransferase family protein [Caulobacteraceae bacterium]
MTHETMRLSPVQAARKAALWVLVIALIAGMGVTGTPLTRPAMHEWIEWIGWLLIGICIVGRCWCTLYIGGRKIAELVRIGPYSMMRNPLYTMSFVGAAGVGAQTGSIVMAGLFVLVAFVVFRIVVAREEKFLTARFGEAYQDYLRSVPRFLPNLRLWTSPEWLEVRPDRVVLTFIDGLWFLAAIPLAEGLEWLQNAGYVPVLLRLP